MVAPAAKAAKRMTSRIPVRDVPSMARARREVRTIMDDAEICVEGGGALGR
ncbi:hypothetical protein Arub01_32120 [Actinomadura rubrobrunea]|uniref:Uncharacterized protein n=1 Tax=Actinomadura rubrobrunea TaxID=115335 RepID=A0A9W6UWF2_9ACTN|nr:hypothetical protein Arub01_32120 [Actinomadura rubrobrunea]